jgi:outer membrane protein OmpA-like peptidoglycan-associated protein
MRQSGPAAKAALIIPVILFAVSSAPVLADVEVDLSAIGARTEADARIATGRAPVQLRYPGETPPTRILLTPPPSIRQAQEAPQEAPKVLGPPDATVVDVQPAPPQPRPPAQIPPQLSTLAAPAPIAANPSSRIEQVGSQTTTTAALVPVSPSAPTPPISTGVPETTAAAQPVQVASLPSPKSAAHRLNFDGGTADILGSTRDELEMVAAELMRHDDRIEIQAFAGVAGDLSSDARRLSLRRGLNVRKFLVERGVLQSRIDVRALGGVRDNGPSERVDILLSRR